MQPSVWRPPVEPASAEQQIVKRIKRVKLFIFLREHRHTLFDETFQQELATMYKDAPQGQPPISPAKLGLAAILQTYTGVSDDELIEAMVMDRRWQLVLDCLDAETPPFSKPTFLAFRERMVAIQIDRRLLVQTVEVAAAAGAFGSRNLRAALDSSPLWGAGRVEDTYNLLGHALRTALGVIARQQGRGLADLAAEAGTPLDALAEHIGRGSIQSPVIAGPADLDARRKIEVPNVIAATARGAVYREERCVWQS